MLSWVIIRFGYWCVSLLGFSLSWLRVVGWYFSIMVLVVLSRLWNCEDWVFSMVDCFLWLVLKCCYLGLGRLGGLMCSIFVLSSVSVWV